MLRILCLILALTISLAKAVPDQPGVVTTEAGQVKGKVIKTPCGQCDAYLGVPFAAPPIGELRWQKPQPLQPWTGVRNASQFGPQCVQANTNSSQPLQGSEDCLQLNVIVPKIAGTSLLPVMVFIHGGSGIFGSGQEYGDAGPCENLAARGVIVVTIQYRLGLYGWLSTGDQAAPGNVGIWDQIEALKWVQKNIQKFRGDPKKVTIFGESHGGRSVSFLTYLAQAKDLFQQSIAQSGSAQAYWAQTGTTSITTANQLATAASCSSSDSNTLITCLQKLSTSDLENVYKSIIDWTKPSDYSSKWSPVIDGELYPAGYTWTELSKKPAIIGVNSGEIPMPDKNTIPIASLIFDGTADYAASDAAGLKTMAKSLVKELIYYQYLDTKQGRDNSTFVAQQYPKILVEYGFHAPLAKEASSKLANGSPVWVYYFDYWPDKYFPADYPFQKSAIHAHELCYLFLLPTQVVATLKVGCPTVYNGIDRDVANYMGEMWTNFAKTGNPSPKAQAWPQFRNSFNASAMVIRKKLSIDQGIFRDPASFWNQLVPKIVSIV